MPTYSYECQKCGHVFDVFHGMSEQPKVKCTKCGSARVQRMIGTGAGIIFKGSGFYETDYKTKKGEAAVAGASDKSADKSGSEKSGGEAGEKKGADKKEPAAPKSEPTPSKKAEKTSSKKMPSEG